MKPQMLFSERGADYARHRPSYPAAAIDTMLKGLDDPSRLVAADAGAGTGIASRLLAERGLRVIALEPNAPMRQAADPHPSIEFRDATAEHTNLADASIDLLTCFQAFHWFDPAPTLAEFRRVLKPTGRLALVWNDWARDEFFAEYSRLVRTAKADQHPPKRHSRHSSRAAAPLLSDPSFAHARRHTFANARKLDLPGLIGYTRSRSSIPCEGPAYRRLLTDLEDLHARRADHRGFVTLTYRTTLYLAAPRRRGVRAIWRRLRQAYG